MRSKRQVRIGAGIGGACRIHLLLALSGAALAGCTPAPVVSVVSPREAADIRTACPKGSFIAGMTVDCPRPIP